jgi:hypothetical protein
VSEHKLTAVTCPSHFRSVPDPSDPLHHLCGLGGVHPGDGLVEEEEEEGGTVRQGDAHPEGPLVAVGEVACQFVFHRRKAPEVDDLEGLTSAGIVCPLCPGGVEKVVDGPGPAVHVEADEDILQDGGVHEQVGLLEGAGDPPAGDLVGRKTPVMSVPSKTTRPNVSMRVPVMRLKTVVFPAPLGPMRLRISPSPR